MGELAPDWIHHSLDELRLERLVLGLTYQDGWTFRLDRSIGGQPAVVVTWTLPDVDDPRALTMITGTVAFLNLGRDSIRHFLFDVWETIGRFEAHERLEQLRFDGETIWNPHPDGSRGRGLVCSPDYGAPLPDLDHERTPA